MGNWMSGPNEAAVDYLNQVVGQSKAYITGGTGSHFEQVFGCCFLLDLCIVARPRLSSAF